VSWKEKKVKAMGVRRSQEKREILWREQDQRAEARALD